MPEQVPDITSLSNPNTHDSMRLTRLGKATVAVAGVGLAALTMGGLNTVYGGSEPENTKPVTPEVAQCFAAHSDEKPTTIEIEVQNGEGEEDIVQRVYGINAPEGSNQVVQNNPCYKDEVRAIRDQLSGNMLHPGDVLNLPTEYYVLDNNQYIPEQQ